MKREERVIEILETALRRVTRLPHDPHTYLGDSCAKCIAQTAIEKANAVPPDP